MRIAIVGYGTPARPAPPCSRAMDTSSTCSNRHRAWGRLAPACCCSRPDWKSCGDWPAAAAGAAARRDDPAFCTLPARSAGDGHALCRSRCAPVRPRDDAPRPVHALRSAWPNAAAVRCGIRIVTADVVDGRSPPTPMAGEYGPYDLVIAADGAASVLRGTVGGAQVDQAYPGCRVVPVPGGGLATHRRIAPALTWPPAR